MAQAREGCASPFRNLAAETILEKRPSGVPGWHLNFCEILEDSALDCPLSPNKNSSHSDKIGEKGSSSFFYRFFVDKMVLIFKDSSEV